MDGGLSWADQWDNNPDPPPSGSSENGKKKGKEGSKSRFGKTMLSFKWMKLGSKKSSKEQAREDNVWQAYSSPWSAAIQCDQLRIIPIVFINQFY